jgi:hypothetical protein
MGVKAQRIRVHIDELVLHGFEPGDRHCIAEALQARLLDLLQEGTLLQGPVSGDELDRADAGTIRVREGSPAGAIGAQLAAALHGGMGRWLSR